MKVPEHATSDAMALQGLTMRHCEITIHFGISILKDVDLLA